MNRRKGSEMGYKSAVAYTIRFIPDENEKPLGRVRDSFYTFLAEAKAKTETQLCFDEDQAINVKEENGEGFYVNEQEMKIDFLAWHVKWYDGYPDVDCHEALLSLAQEWCEDEATGNPYIGGAYVRIGEEVVDNDEQWFGTAESDWLSISRTICRDGKEI